MLFRSVGVFSVFERYFAALTHLAAELKLTNVHFLGHVSDAELVAYYDIADLFLCASEHEGFCVPLVEAFYKQVPVLAYAATAVPAPRSASELPEAMNRALSSKAKT